MNSEATEPFRIRLKTGRSLHHRSTRKEIQYEIPTTFVFTTAHFMKPYILHIMRAWVISFEINRDYLVDSFKYAGA